jgi:hypothetical protein
MGLLISDSFKTVVTIYILIPFLVIPQIILSGIIVNFEELNPKISSPKSIPFYGEIITARWAYEALATYQFMENDYQKRYYEAEKILKNAGFKESFLIREMINKAKFVERNLDCQGEKKQIAYTLDLLNTEIKKEFTFRLKLAAEQGGVITDEFKYYDKLSLDEITPEALRATISYLEKLQKFYSSVYKFIYTKLNDQKRAEDKSFIEELKRRHHNESLEEFVTSNKEIERIVEYKGELIQKKDPIYLDPTHKFIKAHFYAPRKMVFGNFIPTLWVNIGVIWINTILLFLLLYFRVLKRILESFGTGSLKR